MRTSSPPSADVGKEAVDRITTKLAELREAIAEAMDAVSMTDYLTGLGNQKALQFWLEHVVAATEGTFSIAFIEIDRFKKVNDDFGYPDADRLLVAIGEVLKEAQERHSSSIAFRAHGDEFYLAVIHRHEDEAKLDFQAIVDGIRARIAGLEVLKNDEPMKCTASCGWFSPSLLQAGGVYSELSIQTCLQTAVAEAKRVRNTTVRYAPELDQRRLSTTRLDCGACKIKITIDFDPDRHGPLAIACPACKTSLS